MPSGCRIFKSESEDAKTIQRASNTFLDSSLITASCNSSLVAARHYQTSKE